MTKTIAQKIRSQTFSPKNSYPPLEDIIPYITYAISLSPAEEFTSYLETYNHMVNFIIPNLIGHVRLFPELSTKNTRWHYHGTISFTSYFQITNFYKHLKKLKDYSTIVMEEISDFNWQLYCIKQRAHIETYINKMYNFKTHIVPYKIKYSSTLNANNNYPNSFKSNINPLDG